jgi:hypothetical protein
MKLRWALLMFCGFLPVGPVWGQREGSKVLGSWQLRLWVTGPAAEAAGPREASGQIEVRRQSTGPVPRGLQWVFSVTYDNALHVMLGPPKSGPAHAVLRARDTVELAFNPLVDHGAFRLTGVIRSDSIIGTWHRTNFADDGYRGSFTMVRRVAAVPVPPEFRRLEELGELRLKVHSIHGYAPLVMLLTEAPASASEVERRYRQRVTSSLLWNIERMGVSLFSLNPMRYSSDNSDVDQMKRAASAAGEIFRGMKPYHRPQVVIGFADGAVAAARLVLRDSLPAALVALVPGTPGNTQTEGQEVVWQELLRPVDHPREMLVLESTCNSPTSPLAEARFRQRQTVLLLPQYDGWLSRRMSSACPGSPAHAVGMDHEVISMLTDWLKRTVTFPQ